MDESINLSAILVKAQTTVDGGWRVSFDISQDEAPKIMLLTELREQLVQLSVAVVK